MTNSPKPDNEPNDIEITSALIRQTDEYKKLFKAIQKFNVAAMKLIKKDPLLGSPAKKLAEKMKETLEHFVDSKGPFTEEAFANFAVRFRTLEEQPIEDGQDTTFKDTLAQHRDFSAVVFANIGLALIPFVGIPLLVCKAIYTRYTLGHAELFFWHTNRVNQVDAINQLSDELEEGFYPTAE